MCEHKCMLWSDEPTLIKANILAMNTIRTFVDKEKWWVGSVMLWGCSEL